jgi:hypothetical protein
MECIRTAADLNPKEARYQDALALLVRDRPREASFANLKREPALNEESLEFLVKDELRLNFRPEKSATRARVKDAEGK